MENHVLNLVENIRNTKNYIDWKSITTVSKPAYVREKYFDTLD